MLNLTKPTIAFVDKIKQCLILFKNKMLTC